METPYSWGVKCTGGGENLANVAICLENYTQEAHSYYGMLIGSP